MVLFITEITRAKRFLNSKTQTNDINYSISALFNNVGRFCGNFSLKRLALIKINDAARINEYLWLPSERGFLTFFPSPKITFQLFIKAKWFPLLIVKWMVSFAERQKDWINRCFCEKDWLGSRQYSRSKKPIRQRNQWFEKCLFSRNLAADEMCHIFSKSQLRPLRRFIAIAN